MSTKTPPDGLAFHFRHFIGGLCDVVESHIERDGSAARLIVTIIHRLCRRGDRLLAILARFAAGTLRPTSPRAPRGDGAKRAQFDMAVGARAADPVPRCRAYLVHMMEHEAAIYGRILQILLADPEMVALLAASPQAGRLLRPLWRMLSPRPYPPVLRPLPRDLASSPPGVARVCPAPLPVSPCAPPSASPGARYDPVCAVRRSGFGAPKPA